MSKHYVFYAKANANLADPQGQPVSPVSKGNDSYIYYLTFFKYLYTTYSLGKFLLKI